ncbi:MAG TPA: hypothetical protein VHS31_05255 [Tepidisphaeraceae bacterium]|nr:hypothetical protein [Tepidisphaeraceae bacterium]
MRFLLKLTIMILCWLTLATVPPRYQAYQRFNAANKKYVDAVREWTKNLNDDGKAPEELHRRILKTSFDLEIAEKRWLYLLTHFAEPNLSHNPSILCNQSL